VIRGVRTYEPHAIEFQGNKIVENGGRFKSLEP